MKKGIAAILALPLFLLSCSSGPEFTRVLTDFYGQKSGFGSAPKGKIIARIETSRGTIEAEMDNGQLGTLLFCGVADGKLPGKTEGKSLYTEADFFADPSDGTLVTGGSSPEGDEGFRITLPSSSVGKKLAAASLALVAESGNLFGPRFAVLFPDSKISSPYSVIGRVTSGEETARALAEGDTVKRVRIEYRGSDTKSFSPSWDTFKSKAANIGQRVLVYYDENPEPIKVAARGVEAIISLDTGTCNDRVMEALLTPDKNYAVTASIDKTIRIYQASTGKEVRKIIGEKGSGLHGSYYCIAVSPDGKHLAAGGFLGPNEGDSLDIGSIRIFDFATGALLRVLKAHTNTVKSLSYSPDGALLVSGSSDKTAHLWDVKKNYADGGQLLASTGDILNVRLFIANNEYRLVLSTGRNVMLYSLTTGAMLGGESHGNVVEDIRVSKNSIASASRDKTIRVYDHDLKLKSIINCDTNPAEIAFSPSGRYILTGFQYDLRGQYDVCSVYDIEKGGIRVASSSLHENLVQAVCFLDEETALTIGGDNYDLYAWRITAPQNPVWSVKNRGQRFFGVNRNGNSIYLQRQPTTNYEIFLQSKSLDWVYDLKRKTGKAVTDESMKFVLPIPTATKSLKLQYPQDPNGKLTIFYGQSYDMTRLDVVQGEKQVVDTINAPKNSTHIAFGFLDDNTVISGGENGVLMAYRLDDRRVVIFEGHTSSIWGIALGKDFLVSASGDQSVRFWSIKEYETLLKTEQKVREPSFLSDLAKKEIQAAVPGIDITKKSALEAAYKELKRKGDERAVLLLEQLVLRPALSLSILKDGGWIAWTESGLFDGSPGASDFLGFHLNRGRDKEADYIGLNQLSDIYFRPGLIDSVLNGKPLPKTASIEKLAYPPKVSIRAVNMGSGYMSLSLSMKDQGGGIREPALFLNGRRIDAKLAHERKGDELICSAEILLPEGMNSIYGMAQSVDGVKAYTERMGLSGTAKNTTKRELYILAAGIDDYGLPQSGSGERGLAVKPKDPGTKPSEKKAEDVSFDPEARFGNLSLAVKDARDFSAAYAELYPRDFSLAETRVIENEKASKTALLSELSRLSRIVDDNDRLVVYLAGHGYALPVTRGKITTTEFFYVTHDYGKLGSLASNGLSSADLLKALARIKAKEIIIVLDTCQSGSTEESFANDLIGSLTLFGEKTGMLVLASSAAAESSLELPGIHNGLFTHALMAKMRSHRGSGSFSEVAFETAAEMENLVRKASGGSLTQSLVSSMSEDAQFIAKEGK